MLMNERSKSSITITNLRNAKVRRLVIPSTRKFDQLKSFVQVKVDIFVITESKLDKYSTMNQFQIDAFSLPYRVERNRKGGRVLIYVSEDTF